MISLLDDPSERVQEAVRRGLVDHAEAAEPLLRDRLAGARGEQAELIRAALLDVIGRRLERPLIELITRAPDLEAGAILIGRLLDDAGGSAKLPAALEGLAAEVRAELARPAVPGIERPETAGMTPSAGTAPGQGELFETAPAPGPAASPPAPVPSPETDPARQLEALIEVLVRRHGCRGADPVRAEALDAVLAGTTTRGRGLPLALCTLWLLVARRAGIPLVGVNMPGHFLVRLARPDGGRLVIDPFHGGRIVREEDCRRFLTASGYPALDITQLDASDRDMLLRTLRNLVMIATRRKQRELAARCARILERASARSSA